MASSSAAARRLGRRAVRAVVAGLLAGVPAIALAYGTVGTCPADFGALRPLAEKVDDPALRSNATDLVQSGVAQAVFRAGGLDRFVARQRELIESWRELPARDAIPQADRAAMIALHEAAIDVAGCVQRKGDPRRRVDRQDAANRELDSVVALQTPGTDRNATTGSGVLVSPCHVLTSQHVLSGADLPTADQGATVLLGEVREPKPDFAERVSARVVGNSRRYQPDGSIEHDWALLRLERRVDADYPSMPMLPRGQTSPGPAAFGAGRRGLTVAGYPGDKRIEGGGPSALWRHTGCHVLSAQSPIGGWATTCAMNPGQSGGPVLADGGGNKWQLVGLAAAMSSRTRGIVANDETDATHANLVTPVVGETLEEIYRLIDTYSCSD